MKLSPVLWQVAVFLTTPSIIGTLILYFYPVVFGCRFPAPVRQQEEACIVNPGQTYNVTRQVEVAPFRLLAFGDPQLEGDTSLPDPTQPLFPSLHNLWTTGFEQDGIAAPAIAIRKLFQNDIPRLLRTTRKRIDLFGNDFYLAHIYRSLYWWTEPTHVTVLGDLLGSQWIKDEEFAWRAWRFWGRVFKHGRKVGDHFAGTQEVLGQDPRWSRRIINIAGNHDIGYAGDITKHRMERFERLFGKANWDIKFTLPPKAKPVFGKNTLGFMELNGPPELRLVVLNSMNLDLPAFDLELQRETYDFVNRHLLPTARPVEDRKAAVVVLTHIPLHKEKGICNDGPNFEFGTHGIREQNHLSEHGSKAILQAILGMSPDPNAPNGGRGRKSIILNGHDHEGCDVYHYVPLDPGERNGTDWHAKRWPHASELVKNDAIPGIRELTLRSMMGEYGGYAGLLSAWFDEDKQEWQFEFNTCAAGVQHLWWGVHILDLVMISLYVASFAAAVSEELAERRTLAKIEKNLKIRASKAASFNDYTGDGGAVVTSGREQILNSAMKRQSKHSKGKS